MQTGGAGAQRDHSQSLHCRGEDILQVCPLLETRRCSLDEEMWGMLTIMISDANPDISFPAPPHLETGHYLLLTGSTSPRWWRACWRGYYQHSKKHKGWGVGGNTGCGDWKFWCSVWSDAKGGKARGFKFVKWSRARVSWDLIAPKGRSRARR